MTKQLVDAAKELCEALDLPRAANVSCGVDVRHAHERLQNILSDYKPEPRYLTGEVLQMLRKGPKVSEPDSAINQAHNNKRFIDAVRGMVDDSFYKFAIGQVVKISHQLVRIKDRRPADGGYHPNNEYMIADYDEWVSETELSAVEGD